MICATYHSEFRRPVTIALGGGGARGLAHLGALQAVEESDFCIQRIVGVSIGSLAAGLAASGESMLQVQSRVTGYLSSERFQAKQQALFGVNPKSSKVGPSGMMGWYKQLQNYLWARDLFKRLLQRPSILPSKILEEMIAELVPDIKIEDSAVSLSIVAVDLLSGHQVVLERGSLRKAILASAAIPGVFPPVAWGNMLLCDLGVLDSMPSRIAASYENNMVIGVDIGPNMEAIQRCDSALNVMLRMDEIAERLIRRHALSEVDLAIRPAIGNVSWYDFSQPERLMRLGYEAAQATLSTFVAQQFAQRAAQQRGDSRVSQLSSTVSQ